MTTLWFSFYLGFVSLAMFTAVFDYIKPVANSMNSYHYKSNEKVNEQSMVGRHRNMLLFMFLCILKCGLMEQDLANRFNCHLSTISRKIITWANFLYFAIGSIRKRCKDRSWCWGKEPWHVKQIVYWHSIVMHWYLLSVAFKSLYEPSIIDNDIKGAAFLISTHLCLRYTELRSPRVVVRYTELRIPSRGSKVHKTQNPLAW